MSYVRFTSEEGSANQLTETEEEDCSYAYLLDAMSSWCGTPVSLQKYCRLYAKFKTEKTDKPPENEEDRKFAARASNSVNEFIDMEPNTKTEIVISATVNTDCAFGMFGQEKDGE